MVMKPQPFARFGWILTRLGYIPSTRAETTGEGFVARTVAEAQAKPRSIIALSPEGMRAAAAWKRGYYYLASGLNCPIVVAGLDYHFKVMKIFEPVASDAPLETIQPQLQRQMMQIYPYDVDSCYVHVVAHGIEACD